MTKDVLFNLRESYAMMELENSFNKTFHDDGPEGTKIFNIDGEQLRSVFHNYLTTDFIGGGHHYVYKFIPENEIWIEKMRNPLDEKFILAHEMCERMLMKHLGKPYDKSHDIANKDEEKLRAGEAPENIFVDFCHTYFKKPELQNMGRQLALAFLSY